MSMQVTGPLKRIIGSHPGLNIEPQNYRQVTIGEARLTTYEDWVEAAQAGNIGYQVVLEHESDIPVGDFDSIVSSCRDVPCGP